LVFERSEMGRIKPWNEGLFRTLAPNPPRLINFAVNSTRDRSGYSRKKIKSCFRIMPAAHARTGIEIGGSLASRVDPHMSRARDDSENDQFRRGKGGTSTLPLWGSGTPTIRALGLIYTAADTYERVCVPEKARDDFRIAGPDVSNVESLAVGTIDWEGKRCEHPYSSQPQKTGPSGATTAHPLPHYF